MEAGDDLEWFAPRPNRCLRLAPSADGYTSKRRTHEESQRFDGLGHSAVPSSNHLRTSDGPAKEVRFSTDDFSREPDRPPAGDFVQSSTAEATFQECGEEDDEEEDDPFDDEYYYKSEFKTVAIPSGSRDRFPISPTLTDSAVAQTGRASRQVQQNGDANRKVTKSSSLNKHPSLSRLGAGFSMQPEDVACDEAGYLHRSNTSLNKSTNSLHGSSSLKPLDAQTGFEGSSSRSSPNLTCSSSFNVHDASPELIQQRLTLLLDNRKFEECAILIQKIPPEIFQRTAAAIPVWSIISAIPQSLCILHALYDRCHSGSSSPSVPDLLPSAVLSRLVEWLANDEDCALVCGEPGSQSRFLPHIRELLQMIARVQPRVLRDLCRRERKLALCLQDLGIHGLVDAGTTPVSLHDALKSELQQATRQLKAAMQRLEDAVNVRSLRKRRNSELANVSHQRLIQMSQADVERRLIHNKSLLDLIKPAIDNSSLANLLRELEARIEADKRVVVLFSELNKELTNNVSPNAMLAPVFQRLYSACKYLHAMATEVCRGEPWAGDEERGSSTSFSGSDAPVQRPTPPIDPDKPQVTRSQDDIHIKSQPISSDVASANGSACNTVSTGPESNQDVERLRSEVKQLRRELSKCHETIQKLQDREAVLKDRLSEQALRCIEVSSKFEDLSLGNDRPTQLIRRYGNLYTETRLDAFDALEDLPEIADFDDLKGKLLFSVVVLAFRSVQRTLADTRARVRQLLCMPAPDSKVREPVARQVEDMIGLYLRKSVSRYDTSKNVEEVCDQVWSTLYDYPSLRQCEGLRRYITECVQLAWALSVQNPPLVIDYNCDVFNEDVHTRFHTSNPESTRVLTVLWPILREGEGGPCVYKGVVIT